MSWPTASCFCSSYSHFNYFHDINSIQTKFNCDKFLRQRLKYLLKQGKMENDIATLLKTMKGFGDELKELKNGADEGKMECLTRLETKFSGFTMKVFEILSNLNNKIERLENRHDESEQYSRRNCLLLHGIPEANQEDPVNLALTLFKNKLHLSIGITDIDRAHRLGPIRQKIHNKKKISQGRLS